MKRFSYLLTLLVLLDGSLIKRFKIVKDLNHAITLNLHNGIDIKSSINSVGNISEIIKMYDDIHQNTKKQYLVFCLELLTSLFLLISIVKDIIFLINQHFSININFFHNTSVFIAGKIDVTILLLKIIITLVLLLIVLKKTIKYYICNISKK